MSDIPTITLNNGGVMPQFGLGVWQASDADAEQAVTWALQADYRLIDTAALYGNEAGVGRAVQSSNIPRTEIFVTSKVWNSEQGYDKTLRAFDKTMQLLGLDQLDLYLIHWPMPAANKYPETWRALERLYEEKRIRAIGVSNFQSDHIQTLLQTASVVPAVNQIELHPYLQQHETREVCEQHNIAVESWSPLGGSNGTIMSDPVIVDIAQELGKTPAQVILRWHVQSGLIVIPKSVHHERIQENRALFDFTLTEQHMQAISGLDQGLRMGPDPATANFV